MAAEEDPGRAVRVGLAKLYEATRRGFKQMLEADGQRWADSLKASIRGPLVLEGKKAADLPLAARHGESGLRGSFGWDVSGTEQLHGMTGQKFTTSKYALIHEMGGHIRPRIAKMLAIPLRAAMTGSGIPRQPGPRWYGRQLFVLRVNGKVFLVRRKPGTRRQQRAAAVASVAHAHGVKTKVRDQALEFMYVLKNHVYIPPRLKMREFHERSTAQRLADLEVFTGQQLQKGFPGQVGPDPGPTVTG